MICENATIVGEVQIGDNSILHPDCCVTAIDGSAVNIGEGNIIEEKVQITNSTLGHANLCEVGAVISDSTVGSFNKLSPKCKLLANTVVGDYCVIGPAVVIENAVIPDKTAVYSTGIGWATMSVELSTLYPIVDAYRNALSSEDSPSYIGKHHALL
mmetsp:Transcript_16605/g.24992  ORF Transcript_16605/g.24992 Transcript_16605/m.24992 type:complete len:156 (-) Transcript_16605:126-593(-)